MIFLNEIPLDEEDGMVASDHPFTDLAPYFSGDLELEKPTIAESWDPEHHLFYVGRLNEIHSEPGIGKTNILLVAVIAEIRRNRNVIYIDPEDMPTGFVRRMRHLGATSMEISNYVHYLHNPGPKEIQEAQVWALQNRPSLVILDGMAESMASQGMDEDKAQDVLPFLDKNTRPFTEAGAAVVIADHVTKSTEGRGQFARGSGAKSGRYDGVVYEVVLGKSYRPNEEGFVKLKIQKDRNGGVGRKGEIYAELHFLPGSDGGTVAEFRKPTEKSVDQQRPIDTMDKSVKFLELHGEMNATGLRKQIGGNTEIFEEAKNLLLKEGLIEARREGNQVINFLKKKTF